MARETPVSNEIYHIYNRGVDKRNVFLDDSDRFRFVRDLFDFNDSAYSPKFYAEVELPHKIFEAQNRDPLVELMAFCLMDNHFHLLMRQKQEGGITDFMRKLGTGYTNYFNGRYERSGSLFEGRYKLVRIVDSAHFIHLPYYIHLNPLDVKFPRWRERSVKNYKEFNEIISFLEKYRWSSFLDYIGIRNFPFVTQRDFILSFFDGNPVSYREETMKWLESFDVESIGHLTIE
jgi:putative transposase